MNTGARGFPVASVWFAVCCMRCDNFSDHMLPFFACPNPYQAPSPQEVKIGDFGLAAEVEDGERKRYVPPVLPICLTRLTTQDSPHPPQPQRRQAFFRTDGAVDCFDCATNMDLRRFLIVSVTALQWVRSPAPCLRGQQPKLPFPRRQVGVGKLKPWKLIVHDRATSYPPVG